jgi:hypothetical protein
MDRNVASAAAVFAAALAIVVAQPAAAAVTATLTASTPSYSGKCPTTEAFTGAISGPPGTTFKYSFIRSINSVQQVQNIGPATIPNGGSFPVSDSFSVPATSTGSNYDQVSVQVISFGGSNVLSNQAVFSVTCTGAANPYGVLHQANTLVRPVITLHTKSWAWRKYEYKWVGMTGFQPEVGTGPCADLCTGWVHIHNGDSFYLYHWNFYLRSAVLFDQGSITGAHVNKATLTITPTTGQMGCFGGIGRATVSWIGGTNDFNAPYPVDADFSAPVKQITASTFTFDVTPIVQAWASGSWINNGFVLRGRSEDNGSNGNDACTVDFATDAVLTITLM